MSIDLQYTFLTTKTSIYAFMTFPQMSVSEFEIQHCFRMLDRALVAGFRILQPGKEGASCCCEKPIRPQRMHVFVSQA